MRLTDEEYRHTAHVLHSSAYVAIADAATVERQDKRLRGERLGSGAWVSASVWVWDTDGEVQETDTY